MFQRPGAESYLGHGGVAAGGRRDAARPNPRRRSGKALAESGTAPGGEILRMMASSNVELVRSIFAAWERGDFSSTKWADPEIEYVIADGPAPGSWRGLPGMAEGWRNFLNAWEDYRAIADEYVELDDDRVVVLLHDVSGRGKTSGIELRDVRGKRVNLFHLRGGKVHRLVIYFEGERALADLGLTPDAN
jgi:ketosteroid isomerase-like protein